ncbi:MAG TPA: tetratricopeptide repeat protein [Rhodopila sp.]|nr:tetratricopeptide repeat protein [Rhodopila sp.]
MSILLSRRRLACITALAAITRPALAADMSPAKDAPDLSRVRAAIKAHDYKTALAELKALEPENPHPDVYNLMGYALRKSGDRSQAMIYYNKALALDPSHKGALEYQGELYVELGQLDKARENLRKLGKLCWFGCEEESDLKAAIEQASKPKPS